MVRDNVVRVVTADGDDGADAATTLGHGGIDQGAFSQFRRSYVAATEPKWPREVVSKLTSLLRLRPGWDSYGAPAPRYDAAMFALTILENVMRAGTPGPSVVPSSTGGIQLEWHEKNIDLEIHVLAPYKGEVWWFDHTSGVEKFAELAADLSILQGPISKMSD